MAQPICTVTDCDRPHRARGLCSTHYNQQQTNRHRQVTVPCAACRKPTKKDVGRERRYGALYCSLSCRDAGRRLGASSIVIHRPTPAWHRGFKHRKVTAPAPAHRVWTAGNCRECCTPFVTNQPHTTFCSRSCARAWHRRDWKTRTERIVPIATRRHVYARDKGICGICHTPVLMDAHYLHPLAPTLDHIECQSWTPTPDHSPSNLRLAHRQCNSLRGDEGRHLLAA